MNEKTFALFRKFGKDRFGIDPALLIGNEHVFILVHDLERALRLLRGREEVLHLVARVNGHIRADLFAVDADLFVFEQRAEAKRSLRANAIGEVFERAFPAYDELFQLVFFLKGKLR